MVYLSGVDCAKLKFTPSIEGLYGRGQTLFVCWVPGGNFVWYVEFLGETWFDMLSSWGKHCLICWVPGGNIVWYVEFLGETWFDMLSSWGKHSIFLVFFSFQMGKWDFLKSASIIQILKIYFENLRAGSNFI